MTQSYTDYIRSIDAHSPVSSEFRIRTLSGAIISLFTLLLTFYLISTEYAYNLAPTFLDHVRVMPQSPDGLEVEFDITFHHIPCALLATDANDPTGQSQSFHIDKRHRVWKHRLDKDGERIGRKSRFELGGTLTREDQLDSLQKAKEMDKIGEMGDEITADGRMLQSDADKKGDENSEEADDEEDCGSCYGAGEAGECCNTCDDVKRAYRRKQWHIPDITKVDQCAHVVRASDEEGEGCNVHGYVALSTGGGNLHFAPDRQWEKEGDATGGINQMFGMLDLNSVIEMFNDAFEQFNVSHKVNQLSFGPYMSPRARNSLNLTSQLEGVERSVADGYAMFQYYLQVVPTVFRFLNGTTFETFQYSVTEHTRHVDPGSNRGLPGVFFFYEVSALHVEFEEYRRGWTHFFTGVCAAVGGAFTVMGMLDRGLFEWKSGGGGEELVR
mmetsp:Transcript_36946/g.78808  ORF Transcript_36946/g.78808 Transcript_36946/m.78808 type:complete len:441 (-) Transcript_36946:325-1647(-)|eukprot:CAMPEP_0172534058 /NCGR_PEP_ID=MMETSP1067-20121228/6560_1 /TAXON_ID=265564 ORGANISM="Thalassiosira punctigera, Strain Tpunct2005C2" /NCGR_SAMPLE_ID=MMETSP1067 /ASSEMBLY_ACC=CAM_ASM_000444 /LENGTH=440 /DNA_ID=CAMNT_0013318793 /DNA_START=141 /DNA_END=1463 /DNA_ORIENTATION=+